MSINDYIDYIETNDAIFDDIAFEYIDMLGSLDNDNFFQKAFDTYYKEGQVLCMHEVLSYGLQTCLHGFLDYRPILMASGDPPPKKGYRPIRCINGL